MRRFGAEKELARVDARGFSDRILVRKYRQISGVQERDDEHGDESERIFVGYSVEVGNDAADHDRGV